MGVGIFCTCIYSVSRAAQRISHCLWIHTYTIDVQMWVTCTEVHSACSWCLDGKTKEERSDVWRVGGLWVSWKYVVLVVGVWMGQKRWETWRVKSERLGRHVGWQGWAIGGQWAWWWAVREQSWGESHAALIAKVSGLWSGCVVVVGLWRKVGVWRCGGGTWSNIKLSISQHKKSTTM